MKYSPVYLIVTDGINYVPIDRQPNQHVCNG